MMDTLEFLERRLIELQYNREEYITQGKVTSWEEYKQVTGVIQGLQIAANEIATVRKNQIEE
jgi:hypothetical protein